MICCAWKADQPEPSRAAAGPRHTRRRGDHGCAKPPGLAVEERPPWPAGRSSMTRFAPHTRDIRRRDADARRSHWTEARARAISAVPRSPIPTRSRQAPVTASVIVQIAPATAARTETRLDNGSPAVAPATDDPPYEANPELASSGRERGGGPLRDAPRVLDSSSASGSHRDAVSDGSRATIARPAVSVRSSRGDMRMFGLERAPEWRERQIPARIGP